VLFPSLEDYGIVPLEAAAAGRPTIALGQGGVLETMIGLDGGEPPTAVFFAAPTVESLAAAITTFERHADRFEPAALRARAARFDRPQFARRVQALVQEHWRAFRERVAC
jgi:glycosyltransferase involved in cell wall biosynthesis